MATPPSRPPECPFCGTLGFRAPRTTLGHSFLFYSLHCVHPSPKRSFFIQHLPFPLGVSNLRAGLTATTSGASPVSEGLTHSRCSGTGMEGMNLGLSPGFWFLLRSLLFQDPILRLTCAMFELESVFPVLFFSWQNGAQWWPQGPHLCPSLLSHQL